MRGFRGALVGCVIGLVLPASASAATLIVQAGAADGTGSAAGCTAAATTGTYNCLTLRDAITFANTSSDAGANPTIELSAGGFSLSSAIAPDVPLTITGAGDQGSPVTTINETGMSYAISASAALTLNDLVVTGNGSGAVGQSGGIIGYSPSADVPLTLNGVTVTGSIYKDSNGANAVGTTPGIGGNSAFGAAIDDSGTLTLMDSVVSGNQDIAGDGGSGNTTEGPGQGGSAGGVIDTQGLVMTASIVTDNTATGGNGGAAGGTGQAGAAGGSVSGAGIYDLGSSTINSSLISDNHSIGGNGGQADGTAQGGSAGTVLGGGLYLSPASTSDVVSFGYTTVTGNTAEAGTPAANAATGGLGGNADYAGGAGLFATGTFPLTISLSTFSANQSTVQNGAAGAGTEVGYAGAAEGAALYVNNGPETTIVNSTMSGNTAQSGTGSGTTGTIGSFGGAIDAYGGGSTRVGLYNDTIAGNTATSELGVTAEFGANILGIATPLTFQDTAIADPEPGGTSNCALQSSATITDSGHNLEDDTSCELSATKNDQIVTSAGLPSSLGANGGPFVTANGSTPAIAAQLTLAPAVGSPLIGNGGACTNPLASSPPFPALTIDERDKSRPAVCDIGAFQTEPLTTSGSPTITGTPAVGKTLTCSTGTFAIAGDGAFTSTGAIGAPAITYSWSSSGTIVGSADTYPAASTDEGHKVTCTETATGAYGHGSATSASVQILAPAVTLEKVTEAHRKWAEKHFKHGPPVGTSFDYTLDTPATVTLAFARRTTGRKVKGKCVAATHANRRKASCKLALNVGKLTQNGLTGPNKLVFTGRISGKTLPTGSYTVTITARAATGTVSHTLSFTIAR